MKAEHSAGFKPSRQAKNDTNVSPAGECDSTAWRCGHRKVVNKKAFLLPDRVRQCQIATGECRPRIFPPIHNFFAHERTEHCLTPKVFQHLSNFSIMVDRE